MRNKISEAEIDENLMESFPASDPPSWPLGLAKKSLQPNGEIPMKTKETSMVKGSAKRLADHAVDPLFIDRWSPRSMSGEAILDEELMVLFEAARWAPSSYNNQPWRILYAKRDTDNWPLFFDLLVDGNKAWAKNAAVLLVLVSKTTFDYNGKPSVTHSFDTGAAWENLALQAFLKGYVAHGMEGFDFKRAKVDLKVPDGFQVEAMVAIGKPAPKNELPAKLQESEAPNNRRTLSQTICEGPFTLVT